MENEFFYRRGIVRKLHGPGPSPVSPEVLDAMGSPTIGHLDPDFVALMDDVQRQLRLVFKASDAFAMPASGTGSAGMEMLAANLTEPGDEVLVVVNGVFGGRIAECVEFFGGKAHTVDLEWGATVSLETLEKELDRGDFQSVWVVHAETSTGAMQPRMKEIGELVHSRGALFLVDCVTSLGGAEVDLDGWNADAAYSGTQKCLSVPPGLSPVALRSHAVEKLEKRKTPPATWYLNLVKIMGYWKEKSRARSYHHTAPINNVCALHRSLEILLDEGLDKAHARHADNADRLREGLLEMGFEYAVKNPGERLPMLHALYVPEGVNEAELRSRLLERNIEIGGGLGKFAGKAIRIGLMGHGSRRENVDMLLENIRECM